MGELNAAARELCRKRPLARPGRGARAAGRVLALVCVLACSAGATELAPSRLIVAHAAGPGWQARDLRVAIDWAAASGPHVSIELAELTLPEPVGQLRALSVDCAGVSISAVGLRCHGAQLETGRWPAVEFDLVYDALARELRVDFSALLIAEGRVALSAAVDLSSGTVVMTLDAHSLALAALPAPAAPVSFSAGHLDVRTQWRLDSALKGRAHAELRDVAFSDESGRRAAETLSATLDVELAGTAAAGPWRGELRLTLDHGGVYLEPVYIDLVSHPLELAAQFDYAPGARALALTQFHATQRGVLDLNADNVRIEAGSLVAAECRIRDAVFPALYDAYLAGILVGTPLARLDIAGRVRGRFKIEQAVLHAIALEVEQIDLEDRDGRFALYGLAGDVHWARDGAELEATSLALAGGFIYGAGFDASTLELGMAGQAIDLLEPLRVPLLGGAVVVNTFTLRDYGSDELALGFEAELEPIDLGQLTLALDWPPFAGSLGGRLPLLSYHRGVVTVGGNLEAQAFDGAVTIENLRITRPFGLVPELEATIRVRNLDLGRVTQVVPFGRVSGRLEGDIVGLRMIKGEPVAFDARLQTPPDDDSRHRLSQRAVDTISRVAGGGAALSTTFLRVFKQFAYDELGLACRLENDVCHMDGVAEAEAGYYIVKGAGVPRVDLIGRVRRVQWSRLIAQLKEALAEGEFRIE